MEDFARKSVHALSHGQKKRICVAGILAMEPQVIILDEPTAGLDPFGVHSLMHLLEDLNKNAGITMIMATHVVDLVPFFMSRSPFSAKARSSVSGPRRRFSAIRESDRTGASASAAGGGADARAENPRSCQSPPYSLDRRRGAARDFALAFGAGCDVEGLEGDPWVAQGAARCAPTKAFTNSVGAQRAAPWWDQSADASSPPTWLHYRRLCRRRRAGGGTHALRAAAGGECGAVAAGRFCRSLCFVWAGFRRGSGALLRHQGCWRRSGCDRWGRGACGGGFCRRRRGRPVCLPFRPKGNTWVRPYRNRNLRRPRHRPGDQAGAGGGRWGSGRSIRCRGR